MSKPLKTQTGSSGLRSFHQTSARLATGEVMLAAPRSSS